MTKNFNKGSINILPFLFPIILIIGIILFIKPLKELFNNTIGKAGNLFGGVFSNITDGLGITESQTEKTVKAHQENPYSPFSPLFYQYLKTQISGDKIVLIKVAEAKKIIENINSSFGYFYDDFEKIFAEFKKLRYQTQVSFLAERWQKEYGKDLLTSLRGNQWPADRLSNKELQQVINYVTQLPKHK